MSFYNRALKTESANLMEMRVDFMVKENCGCRGCSSSSQEFSLDQLSVSEIVTQVNHCHAKSVLSVQWWQVLNANAGVTPDGTVSKKHGCFMA